MPLWVERSTIDTHLDSIKLETHHKMLIGKEMTELRKVMSILCYGAGFEGSVSDSRTFEIHQKMFLVTNGR